MAKILINDTKAEPLNCSKIIKGEVREVTNPVTGVTTTVGDGEVLWDIKANRNAPYFLLAFEENRN